jgi:hypothetical protein
MKNSLYCRLMEDRIYEYAGDRYFPLRYRLQLALHILFCPRCAGKLARLEGARELLRDDFFPQSAAFSLMEDRIMAAVGRERVEAADWEAAREVSFRSWVITGLIILVSLGTVILGMDFATVAASSGSGFLIPLGLTVGMVVTVYGAIFIGTHIKALSRRFGLRHPL